MPTAEIIAIGSELLLGETLDTNTQFLLRNFRTLGIDVFRTMIIGDNIGRIVQAVKNAWDSADIVITTGGLGPTVDDPTRGAIAAAFDCELVCHPELWEEICAYYARWEREPTLNNKRQAYIPASAEAISNPTGTAPAFFIYRDNKFLVSLPGVPKEMKYLFTNSVIPLLDRFFQISGSICMRNLHSYGIGESAIDELVGDLEKTSNPSLGLCARAGQIDLRITAKAESPEAAEKMVDAYETVLREKLGNVIFGTDEDTLDSVVSNMLTAKNAHIRLLELNGYTGLLKRLPESQVTRAALPSDESPDKITAAFFAESSREELPWRAMPMSSSPGHAKSYYSTTAEVHLKREGQDLSLPSTARWRSAPTGVGHTHMVGLRRTHEAMGSPNRQDRPDGSVWLVLCLLAADGSTGSLPPAWPRARSERTPCRV